MSLLHFATALQGRHVLIQMNNVAAKAHVNKQGGTRSSRLHGEALLLFAWTENHLESIRAEHVRGLDNIQVDWLSRETISLGEWALHIDVFSLLTEHFGVLDVDLFATHRNRKVPRFFCRVPPSGGRGPRCAHLAVPMRAA